MMIGTIQLEAWGHWEAYCIAGEDLGLDITSVDVDWHLASQQTPYRADKPANNTTPSRANTPSKASSHPSIICIHKSPAAQDITQLAAALHIDNFPMSQTIDHHHTNNMGRSYWPQHRAYVYRGWCSSILRNTTRPPQSTSAIPGTRISRRGRKWKPWRWWGRIPRR